MIIVNTPGSWEYVYPPLLHAEWHGCTPTDLVFPFFLYVVGLSMAFSFRKYQKEERAKWISKVLKRTALIFLVGLLLNWFPFFNKHIENLRILGVLQRIALAYGGASLLIIFAGRKWIINKILLILIAYWAMLYWMGLPGDPYSLEGNFASDLDIMIFGESHVYKGFGIPFDPEGLFSTLPAVATVLIGYWIGILIQSRRKVINKIKTILPYAVGGIIVGLLWNQILPINKPLWTSSYVVYTAGIGTAIFAILLFLIDLKGFTSWTYPFRVFGLNPLISYVMSGIFVKIFLYVIFIGESNFYGYAYSTFFQPVFGNYFGSLMFALSLLLLVWIIAWQLYRRKVIIKL